MCTDVAGGQCSSVVPQCGIDSRVDPFFRLFFDASACMPRRRDRARPYGVRTGCCDGQPSRSASASATSLSPMRCWEPSRTGYFPSGEPRDCSGRSPPCKLLVSRSSYGVRPVPDGRLGCSGDSACLTRCSAPSSPACRSPIPACESRRRAPLLTAQALRHRPHPSPRARRLRDHAQAGQEPAPGLQETVLRARRQGKPHQGAPIRFVRRPHHTERPFRSPSSAPTVQLR